MKIPWLKYIASYFYLVTIKKIPSEINPGLCLQMEAGRLLLNTTNANYSYGNLHRVFEEVFEIIEIEKKPPQNLLLLGLGTGSVIDILQRQYGFEPKITALEIDPSVISALVYWDNLNLEDVKIVVGDAFNTLSDLKPGFDLIIVDLFLDLEVHPGIHEPEFLEKLKYLSDNMGKILINYVVDTPAQKQKFAEFMILLSKHFQDVKSYEMLNMNRVLEINMP